MGGEAIEHYNGERGSIQSEELMRQPTDFSGMLFEGRKGYKNVTPTDVDGFVQLAKEQIFIFFELKYSGDMPEGQKTALCSLVDALDEGGYKTTLILAVHGTKAPEAIKAKNARAVKYYYKHKWYDITKEMRTLYQTMNGFLEFTRRGK